MMFGMVNGDMFGTVYEPYERVDWKQPDYWDADVWKSFFHISIEEYADTAPHMIIFEVE